MGEPKWACQPLQQLGDSQERALQAEGQRESRQEAGVQQARGAAAYGCLEGTVEQGLQLGAAQRDSGPCQVPSRAQ